MKNTFIKITAAFMVISLLLTGCSQKEKPSDTVKWFNTTYAILTSLNEGDGNFVGSFAKTEENKSMMKKTLKSDWEITDRATADKELNWLLKEGHRDNFKKEFVEIKKDGLLEYSDKELEEVKTKVKDGKYLVAMIQAYKKGGDHAIDAWDYSRAIQLLGYFYIAGYYTKEETLNKSLEVAKTIQKQYSSWDTFVESYLTGYQYWKEDDASDPTSDSAERRKTYEKLKSGKDSPYKIAWNTELKKTW